MVDTEDSTVSDHDIKDSDKDYKCNFLSMVLSKIKEIGVV